MGADEFAVVIRRQDLFGKGGLPVRHVRGDGVPELHCNGNPVFDPLLLVIGEQLLVGMVNCTEREEVAAGRCAGH